MKRFLSAVVVITVLVSSIGGFGGVRTAGAGCGVWVPVNEGLPGKQAEFVAIDPTNGRTVYAGFEAYGVFKSTDGGSTWSAIDEGLTTTAVWCLAIDPARSQTIYVGTERYPHSEGLMGSDILKSTNGGSSWSVVLGCVMDRDVRSLAIDPANPQTVYAGTSGNGGPWGSLPLVLKSTDGGSTWNMVDLGDFMYWTIWSLAIDPAHPGTVYAGTGCGVFKSTDGGHSWSGGINALANIGVQSLAIALTTTEAIFAGTEVDGVFKSTDGGSTWMAVNDGLVGSDGHRRAYSLAIEPADPQTICVGTDDGVYWSADSGSTWHATDSGLANTCVVSLAIDPTRPRTAYAGTDTDGVFKWVSAHTLTYLAGRGGTIAGTSPQVVSEGASGTAVTAVPNAGYHFMSWTDGFAHATRTDANVADDLTVTATFDINAYTLTYTAGEGGTITGTSPQTINYGADGTEVTAVPSDHYHFVQWSDGVTMATRTDTSVQADLDVTATFALDTCTLTVNSVGNGTVDQDPPTVDGTYAYGTGVTLTAAPATGWHFVSWSTNVTVDEADPLKATLTMADAAEVTATFALNTYTLTITTSGSGTVTADPAPTDGTCAYGTEVTLTAEPATGYTFTGWSGDLTGTTNPATITVDGDKNVTADFTINTYTVTTNVSGQGTAVPDKSSYAYGDVAHVTITPASGYVLTAVTDNGGNVTNQLVSGVYTIASMTANHTIGVTFTASVPVVVPGDIDGDGHVTMLDALLCARAAVGMTSLTGSALQAADVDHSGTITMLDVLLIARIAVGLST